MPAFGQTRVPRIIQVLSGAVNSQLKGSSSVGGPDILVIISLPRCPPCMTVSYRRTVGYSHELRCQSSVGVRSPHSPRNYPTITHRQRLMLAFNLNLSVIAERRAALHFKATRLQARAVDAAPRFDASVNWSSPTSRISQS
jgi:hypothetical protein